MITNTEPQVQPRNFRNRYMMGLGKCNLGWHPHIDWEKQTFYSESTTCLSKNYQPKFRKGEPIPLGSLTARPWKMVVGRRSPPIGNAVTFQGKLLVFRRVNRSTTLQGQKMVKPCPVLKVWEEAQATLSLPTPNRLLCALLTGGIRAKKIVRNLPKWGTSTRNKGCKLWDQWFANNQEISWYTISLIARTHFPKEIAWYINSQRL